MVWYNPTADDAACGISNIPGIGQADTNATDGTGTVDPIMQTRSIASLKAADYFSALASVNRAIAADEDRQEEESGGGAGANANANNLLALAPTRTRSGDTRDTADTTDADDADADEADPPPPPPVLGAPSLEITDTDLDAYLEESMCKFGMCGGGGGQTSLGEDDDDDLTITGPITMGRVASDVRDLLLSPTKSYKDLLSPIVGRSKSGHRRGGRGGRSRGGSFADDDVTISSTFDSASASAYSEDDYTLASEMSGSTVGGGDAGGNRRGSFFANMGTLRQRERPPPMPTCREQEDEEGADDLTLSRSLSNHRKPASPRSRPRGRAGGPPAPPRSRSKGRAERDMMDDLTLSNRRKTAKPKSPPTSPRSRSKGRAERDMMDDLTLSNRRRTAKPKSPLTSPRSRSKGGAGGGRAVPATAAAAPVRRVMSDTSLSQHGREVTEMQHRFSELGFYPLSTDGDDDILVCKNSPVPFAAKPSQQPRASSPLPAQVSGQPTRVTSMGNIIDLRTPKSEKRPRSVSLDKTKSLKHRKEVEAQQRRAAMAQRESEKAAEKAKLDAIRSKRENERRIAQAAEAEARRVEKEQELVRILEEKEQRKHEMLLAAARKEQQREEERARKEEEAQTKAREAEERRKVQAAEAEQKHLEHELALEQAREQKLAAAVQKKAAIKTKKRAKAEKKFAKQAKKDKTNDIAAYATSPSDAPQSNEGVTDNAISDIDPTTAADKEGVNASDTDSPATNDESRNTDAGTASESSPSAAPGGIFDSIVPVFGATTAAGAFMMPNWFGFGEPAKSEVIDVTDERCDALSPTVTENALVDIMIIPAVPPPTPEEPELDDPPMPEVPKLDEKVPSDTETTSNHERKKKNILKRASVATLVTGAFAKTRSMSRSRNRERESQDNKKLLETNERQVESESTSHTKQADKPVGILKQSSASAGVPSSVVRNRALVYQAFSDDPMSSLKLYKFNSSIALPASSDDIFIKVQASTVSFSDCLIRQGMWWGTGSVSLPATPGVDVVGRVCNITEHAAQKYGIEPDDYVAALIRCGGNSRYVKASGASLVKVPASVDPTAAACMVETYLSAFQSLHVGEMSNSRYSSDCFAGKNILIVGGISMVGQAMIELAKLAGASNIYATARPKHHMFLRSIGAIPLPIGIVEWLPLFTGKMDIVVDVYCIDHYDDTANSLIQDGKLVCIRSKPTVEEQDLVWHVGARTDDAVGFFGGKNKMICTYDIFESWEGNLSLCKVRKELYAVCFVCIGNVRCFIIPLTHNRLCSSKPSLSPQNDLRYLFDMLHEGHVKPPIADCIPLAKVAETQKLLEAKRVQGFFVCKPWLK